MRENSLRSSISLPLLQSVLIKINKFEVDKKMRQLISINNMWPWEKKQGLAYATRWQETQALTATQKSFCTLQYGREGIDEPYVEICLEFFKAFFQRLIMQKSSFLANVSVSASNMT